MVSARSVSIFIGFLIFLVALTAWRLWPAFAETNMALGTTGDAAGTTGWIWEVGRQFSVHGWSVFLNGDQLKTAFYGAGLMDPVPVMNPLWRLLYVGVTRLGLAPDNNYDLVIALQFLLAGIVGWFFAASFGLKYFWRFVFVFLMLSIENTSQRIGGHNGLVFIYGPMVALIAASKYSQAPSRLRGLGVSVGLWFSFLSNEYFGYFSFWACLTLILAQHWTLIKADVRACILHHIKLFWPAAFVFLVLLCLSHPSVSLFKIVNLWERFTEPTSVVVSKGPALRESNPASEFLLYGLKNPLAVLESSLIPLPETMLPRIFGRNTGEFTFRWGLVLPLFVWWVLRHEKLESNKLPLKSAIFAVVAVTFLLGMRTDIGLSLGWLTRLFAPMFRVGVRAQFISLICMILLFVLCAQWMWDNRRSRWGAFRTAVLLVFVGGLSTIELARGGPIFGQHAVFPVSELTPLAQSLAGEPYGMTLVVPASEGSNESESYFLSAIHRKPVLNSAVGPADFPYLAALFHVAEVPSAPAKVQLEACGVRYLFEKLSNAAGSKWKSVAGVRLIAENSAGRLYEFPNARNWPDQLNGALTTEVRVAHHRAQNFLAQCVDKSLILSSSGGAEH